MNQQATASALLTVLIAFCTSLLALFGQPGVSHLGDIAPVAYASAGTGAILTGALTYRAKMEEPPNKQSGRARLDWLWGIFLGSLFVMLVACTSVPLTNQIEAASKTVESIALQIDHLQKTGAISNEREDQLLDQLAEVNKTLRSAAILASTCKADCSNAQGQLTAANQLLLQLQTDMEKSK